MSASTPTIESCKRHVFLNNIHLFVHIKRGWLPNPEYVQPQKTIWKQMWEPMPDKNTEHTSLDIFICGINLLHNTSGEQLYSVCSYQKYLHVAFPPFLQSSCCFMIFCVLLLIVVHRMKLKKPGFVIQAPLTFSTNPIATLDHGSSSTTYSATFPT